VPAKGVRTETQTSAGGVAFRSHDSATQIALISVGDPPRWQLPKGIVDSGETAESAAVRAVREEAGIDVALIAPIDRVEYWYQASTAGERVRYHKFVNFFLMRYLSGDVADHDYEVREARWYPLEEALAALAFKSERQILEKAARMLQLTASSSQQ